MDGFTSFEASFYIGLPKQISGAGGVGQYTWKFNDNVSINISRLDILNDDSITDEMRRSAIESAIQRVLDTGGISLIKKTPLTLKGFVGIEAQFKLEKNGAMLIARNYSSREYSFNLTASFFPTTPDFEARIVKTFDTFRVLTPDEVKAGLGKKLESADPGVLPQSPVPAGRISDAKTSGLKGKVKTVRAEIERSSGKIPTDYFFNESGDLVKSISYREDTSTSTIKSYGYLNGARVIKEVYIAGESDPPAAMMPPGQAATSDPRYTSRIVETYDDQKRLNEQTFYLNTGKISYKLAYKYGPSKVEISSTNEAGKLTRKYVYELDDQGRYVNETINYYWSPEREDKDVRVYKYEAFDKEGNWTKRTITITSESKNKPTSTIQHTETRTITYF